MNTLRTSGTSLSQHFVESNLVIEKELELLRSELDAIDLWDRNYLGTEVRAEIDDHAFIARGLRLMEIERELGLLQRATDSLHAKFVQVVDLRIRYSTRFHRKCTPYHH